MPILKGQKACAHRLTVKHFAQTSPAYNISVHSERAVDRNRFCVFVKQFITERHR